MFVSQCRRFIDLFFSVLLKFSFANQQDLDWHKSFQKTISSILAPKKLWQRLLSSKQGYCPPVHSPRWSPWPPWPRIYAILLKFLKVKTASCTGEGNICLFETAAVCWDERSIETLLDSSLFAIDTQFLLSVFLLPYVRKVGAP